MERLRTYFRGPGRISVEDRPASVSTRSIVLVQQELRLPIQCLTTQLPDCHDTGVCGAAKAITGKEAGISTLAPLRPARRALLPAAAEVGAQSHRRVHGWQRSTKIRTRHCSNQERRLTAIAWGLLGPETLASERRTRTLGLGATVRSFNDLAVPGLGGVWFGKQLLLAALGVAVAERVRDSGKRAQNIDVANAVEALACWIALDSTEWRRDPRLRGALKLSGRQDLSFATVSKRTFYVTQPMRQATVQPLRALAMVESNGERFNAFRPTDHGAAFIAAAWDTFRPHKRSVLEHLALWATGVHDDVKNSWELRRALSPLEPMSESAQEFLRESIVRGSGTDARRRRRALEWVESLRERRRQIAWKEKPPMVDELHWRDLRSGALFFAARDAAIVLLDEIESHIGNAADQRMSIDAAAPESVVEKLTLLREHARAFLHGGYDPSPAREATAFCGECAERADASVLERLLFREGHILRQRGRDILPGVAFRGNQTGPSDDARSPEEEGAEVEIVQVTPLPEGISHRVRNLFLMNLDLRGELGKWLTERTENSGAGV